MFSYLTEKEWTILHRYNDFYEFYIVLSKFFFDVPQIPSKSLGKVTNITELNRRKEILGEFVSKITSRSDLISSPYTIKFLKLENHFPDIELFQPLLLANIEELKHTVSAFYFDKKTSLVFVGLSNSSLTGKINNLVSRYFSKKEEQTSIISIYNTQTILATFKYTI